jgi:hypothetical protein
VPPGFQVGALAGDGDGGDGDGGGGDGDGGGDGGDEDRAGGDGDGDGDGDGLEITRVWLVEVVKHAVQLVIAEHGVGAGREGFGAGHVRDPAGADPLAVRRAGEVQVGVVSVAYTDAEHLDPDTA